MTSTDPGQQAERLRTELAATLASIEDKVNVPKRVRRSIQTMARENPIALAAIAVGTAAAVGGALWGVVVLLRRS